MKAMDTLRGLEPNAQPNPYYAVSSLEVGIVFGPFGGTTPGSDDAIWLEKSRKARENGMATEDEIAALMQRLTDE